MSDMARSVANAAQAAARTRTPSADVEQALIDAAESVLSREGRSGLTVRAVATEAGVAPMGVYNRFGGKDGLVEAVLIRAFDGLRVAVAGLGEQDPIQRLVESGRRYRAFALSHPQQYAVMFGNASPGDVLPECVKDRAASAFGELIGHVSYAMAAGAIPAGDAFEVAQQIWSSVHGAVALELNGLVKTPDPAATYEQLLQLLVAGVATRT
jgi:AcrR family transcriptional regulator